MTSRGPIIRRSVALATGRPWHVMAVWAVAFVLMGIAGIGAKHVLKAEDLVISGTGSAKEITAERNAFGRSSAVMVSLEGPQKQLDRYGPGAVESIRRIGGITVSSPWSDGAPELLRERPDRALLFLNIDKELHDAGNKTVPQVRERLRASLPNTIDARVTGQARFSSEYVNLALSGVQKAELVAMPFLLLILLLIFRAPIAAALPLFQGVVVIVLTTGFVTLLGRIMPVNVLAQGSGSVIGLALGVDYSLLFVSRFRDELAAGASIHEAVERSIETAGRTVVFAGAILVLAAMLMVAFTFGWASMGTGSIGVMAAATFSVLAALTLLPACLTLLGENLNRWPIGRVSQDSSLAPLVARMIRKPVAASLLVLIPLLLLCAQALSLSTGGPDLRTLKHDNPVRNDLEAVSQQYGGGVMSPYQVVVRSKNGPITSPSDIRSLERFQLRMAADPKVKYVLGPGTTRVRSASDAAENGPTQLAKFEYGLGAASTGVHDLRRGLSGGAKGANAIASANSSALAGAQQIQNGVGAAADGAGALNNGLSKSASGSRQLDSALDQLNTGAAKIRSAVRDANSDVQGLATGSATLKDQLDKANSTLAGVAQPSSSGAQAAIASAKSSLDGMSAAAKAEPSFQNAYQSLETAQSEVSSQSSSSLKDLVFKYNAIADAFGLGVSQASAAARGASRLNTAVGKLSGGINEVAKNSGALTSGLDQLSTGSGRLSDGLAPLRNGASTLASGLNQLGAGSGQLGAGLRSGFSSSRPLASGLSKLHSSAAKLRKSGSAPVDLKSVSKSAYLTMALLSAAPPAQKQNLRLVLNEPKGGTAARIFLITEEFPTDKSLKPFASRLAADSRKLARTMDATVAVGGPGQSFLDYDRFTHSRIWPLIAALSLMSFLFLLVVFRSPLLAAKAVILNMITVGAAMGVIELLYGGDSPVFGGPGWMEATSFFVVYSTTFALSMDYEIFMINRMRESYLETGSNEIAIRDGVTKTAGIITGSAAVMAVLFLAVAFTSELISNAQMGLGLAVAILIDATVVRLILLPASMRLFGDANWYLPPWLDRLLPNVAIH